MKAVRIALVLAAAALLVASATPAMAAENGKVNGDVTSMAHLALTITGADLHYGSPAQNTQNNAEINSAHTVFTNAGDVQSALFVQGDGAAVGSKGGTWDMTSAAAEDAFVWAFIDSTNQAQAQVVSVAATDLGILGFNDSKDFGSTIDMPTFTTKTGAYSWHATAWVTDPS
ncbi:MAG: hypothetical protein WCJ13_03850 [Coriobacteriia bacterium]